MRNFRSRIRGTVGVTLIELLVALTISLIFVGSVAAAFIQIIRSSDKAEAIVRAHTSARSAVDAIARDLRVLQLDATNLDYWQLTLINRNLTYGNFIDDDGDGAVDEEFFDGYDDDGDWSPADDRHATIGGLTERPEFVGVDDYGDLNVDEDCRFSADELSFIIPQSLDNPGVPRRRVTYRLGTFEGEEHVLLRAVVYNPSVDGTGDTEIVEPVVFDVVSLDILAWNANSNSPRNVGGNQVAYWVSEWDAEQVNYPFVQVINSPDGDPMAPPFKLPAAFLVSVVVNAERVPLSEIRDWPGGGRPIKTARMSTIINVEAIINDTRYREYVRN